VDLGDGAKRVQARAEVGGVLQLIEAVGPLVAAGRRAVAPVEQDGDATADVVTDRLRGEPGQVTQEVLEHLGPQSRSWSRVIDVSPEEDGVRERPAGAARVGLPSHGDWTTTMRHGPTGVNLRS
jgi:hypothetical protein